MLTQRISSSAVCGYSSLSIMFLSRHSAISASACGSIHVVTKVATFRRALPSSISSSWMIWYATSGGSSPAGSSWRGTRLPRIRATRGLGGRRHRLLRRFAPVHVGRVDPVAPDDPPRERRLGQQRDPARRDAPVQPQYLRRAAEGPRRELLRPARVDAGRGRIAVLPDLELPRLRRGERLLRSAAPKPGLGDRDAEPRRLDRVRDRRDRLVLGSLVGKHRRPGRREQLHGARRPLLPRRGDPPPSRRSAFTPAG